MQRIKQTACICHGAIKYGWSKDILELQLENHTLEREGKLPANFDKTLPEDQSDMVRLMFIHTCLILPERMHTVEKRM